MEAKVTIYNCASLMPYCRRLAEKYIVPYSPVAANFSTNQICSYNAQVAMECDRSDLHQIWSLAAVISCTEQGSEDPLRPWATHPCGRSLLSNMILHHVAIKDFQTAALLVCIFGNTLEVCPRIRKNNSKSESIYIEKESACDALPYNPVNRHNRSNSDTQNEETLYGALGRRLSISSDDDESSELGEEANMLDPKLAPFYNMIIETYADLLYRWKMIQKRTEVVKQISELKHMDKYISNISLLCPVCGKVLRGPTCTNCRSLTLTCSVCRTPYRGLVSLCQLCGHGGHALHLNEWFMENTLCPAACGCHCPNKSFI